ASDGHQLRSRCRLEACGELVGDPAGSEDAPANGLVARIGHADGPSLHWGMMPGTAPGCLRPDSRAHPACARAGPPRSPAVDRHIGWVGIDCPRLEGGLPGTA